ncbi:3-phosphoshikimate 1-carboxyvinyltransferase [Bombella sp. TMW 2.2559]|uniref:3-phosphoshikimate 1-carboxyvinyltransferase n=1 Tax=Bombella dulcis TaxID=2967339 RepID=A0ABT3WEQ1_9PROT|nr:3-phosphoshikimate 1-carboxyvinyltransferase [Bombella dulcis]MCX5616819.1 3-phosphoshikimate 1-carboxyvinyltransferase [Bombella dulcis]
MTAQRPLTVSSARTGLAGRVRVPGDKSISHRALMFAALAEGRTHIFGLLEGEDVLRTAEAMRALGAKVVQKDGCWIVDGCGVDGLKEPSDVLDMGNSGTAARLLSGVLATHPFMSIMTGDASLRSRPMGRVSVPLSEMGARFVTRAGQKLPMAVEGTGKGKPLHYRLPVASAQVKSAILLAGLNCEGETVVEEPAPTRDHTENMLRHFGTEVKVEELPEAGRRITLKGPARLVAQDVLVPGDPSSAAFPVVAALLVPGSEIVVEAVGQNPLRTGLFRTLKEMGASLEIRDERVEGGEVIGDLHVRAGRLKAVDVPAVRVPSMIDEYPVLAVACAFAEGTSRLRGLAELRVKESDRLASTVALLEANGAKVHVEGDDLIIEGQKSLPGGGKVQTHMDHRLAMSATVLGLAAEKPVHIDDTAFIETSFPGFVSLMNGLGAGLEV